MSEGEVGKVRRRDRFARRHGNSLQRHSARQDQHVDDDECAGRDSLVDVSRRCREAGRRLEEAARHDSERHPEGIHRAEDLHLPAAAFDEADRRHVRVRHASTFRSGTRSRSAAITFAKPDRRRFRNWHSRCTTASSTSNGPVAPVSTWTSSRRVCPSSSMRTTISSRRSRSTVPPARSGTRS